MEELEKEKLLLEIQKLKNNLEESKSFKTWENFIKPIVPIVITALISIFGWIITTRFNESQLTITERKNDSEKQLAQINASLSFIKLMSEIPDSSTSLQNQAKTVIAPALPPESSFYLAVEDLADNPNILEVLIRTYPLDYWNYLLPYFEKYPLFFKNDAFREPDQDLKLFKFFDERQLLDSVFLILCSESYKSPNRVNSLINFLDYYYAKEELNHSPDKNNEIRFKLISALESTKSLQLKADISMASSIVLDRYHSQYFYTNLSAKYFWDGINLSIGETIKEKSIRQYVYSERFHTKGVYGKKRELPAVDTLSSYLIKKLMKLDYEDFEMDRIRVILYSYAESVNRESKDPFSPYLRPEHSFQLITRIISSLKSEDRKQEFSMILGSLSGDIIFRNISQDKEVGVQYCEMILNWYTMYWNNDWYIPKFFGSVVYEYPEFKSKIDKKWGVGIE